MHPGPKSRTSFVIHYRFRVVNKKAHIPSSIYQKSLEEGELETSEFNKDWTVYSKRNFWPFSTAHQATKHHSSRPTGNPVQRYIIRTDSLASLCKGYIQHNCLCKAGSSSLAFSCLGKTNQSSWRISVWASWTSTILLNDQWKGNWGAQQKAFEPPD